MKSARRSEFKRPEEIIGWRFPDLSNLRGLVAKVTADFVRQPAEVFVNALVELDDLRMIAPNVAVEGTKLFFWSLGYVTEQQHDADKRIEKTNEWLREFVGSEDSKHKIATVIDNLLAGFVQQPALAASLVTVNFVSVPAMWTALECLARDLWIAFINNSSTSIAHKAFRALERDDVQRKFIAISDLVKYGFDIRNKVGNILASKFSFTDFEGIRNAFRVIEPEDDLASDTTARALFLLEKTRHLLVHKAGYVDEKFKRETGDSSSLGTRITLTTDRMQEWANAVVEVGTTMIRTVDSFYRSHSTESNSNEVK